MYFREIDARLNLLHLNFCHEEKTVEIATVKEVWKCDVNYHKIW